MALGQFLMFASACFVKQSIFEENGAIDPSVDNTLSIFLLMCGLVGLILGNGFFKPNISTMVGDLYEAHDTRKDSAFTIFYMGINVGAFIAPFICGTLGEGSWHDLSPFKWGFFCAGVAMLFSLVVFVKFKDKYLVTPEGLAIGLPPAQSELRHEKEVEAHRLKADENIETVKNSPVRLWGSAIASVVLFVVFAFWGYIEAAIKGADTANIVVTANDYISALIYSLAITLPTFIITDRGLTVQEKKHIGVIYIIALFVIFFWSAFEQAGSSLTIFADKQVDRTIGSFEFKTTWFQSINPVVVVTFAPILAALWSFLGKKGLEPASPVKQAIGLLLLGIGYLVIAFATKGVEPGVKISMFWLVALYFIHTMGELSLSPIGLSMVNQLAPARFASLLMGVWFMSNAASNILAGKLATLLPDGKGGSQSFLGIEIATLDDFFMLFAIMACVASVVLFALCPVLKRMMK
jgi:POT family proton-dependent oligopeptide transporter